MNGWMKKWLAGAAVATAILAAATTAAYASPPHHHGGYRPTPHGAYHHSSGYRGPHSHYGDGRYEVRRYDDRRYDDRRYDDRRYDRDWDRDCDRRPVSSGYRGPALRPLPPAPNYNYYAPTNSSGFGFYGRNFGFIFRN